MVSDNQTPHSLDFRNFSGAILCLIYCFCLFKNSIFIQLQLFFLALHFFIQQLGLVDTSCCSSGQMRKCCTYMQPPLVALPLHFLRGAKIIITCSDSFIFACLSLVLYLKKTGCTVVCTFMRDNYWEFLRSSVSMYFLPSNILHVNIERVYHCTCHCI